MGLLDENRRVLCLHAPIYSAQAAITPAEVAPKTQATSCPRNLVQGYEGRDWVTESHSLCRFDIRSAATGVEAAQRVANSAGVSPLSELWGRRWLYVDLNCPITCCASASIAEAPATSCLLPQPASNIKAL